MHLYNVLGNPLHHALPLSISAGCGHPTKPLNGAFLRGFQSTQAGATLCFGCNVGYLPVKYKVATCVPPVGWMPNPADLNCTLPGKGREIPDIV